MDTVGRPTLVLIANNAVEEWREAGSLIVTYDYPWIAGFRKPVTITVAIFAVFLGAWLVGNLDVRIGKMEGTKR
jgi:oligosaccharyltransferase complex subunit alpha (ribophorin I)